MTRSKAPPFKQRLQSVIDAVRGAHAATGFKRLKVTMSDGTIVEFTQQDLDPPTTDGAAEVNDFDEIINEQKRRRHDEEKP